MGGIVTKGGYMGVLHSGMAITVAVIVWPEVGTRASVGVSGSRGYSPCIKE